VWSPDVIITDGGKMAIHEDMVILTPEGEKQLKGLKKVNQILDASGTFRSVVATLIEDYHGYFYEFFFKCFPFTLKCNADQMVYSVKDIGSPESDDDDAENRPAREIKPALVKASTVSIYEYMGMPFLQETPSLMPSGLPVDQDDFWFFMGIVLNKLSFGKPPKIEGNRVTIAIQNEENIYVKFPPGINRIPTINGVVMLSAPLGAYIASVMNYPLQLLFLPKKCQSALYDGYFFYEHSKLQETDNLNVIYTMWYIYCRLNKKLGIIQASRNREYKLSIPANPTSCVDNHMWFRITDVKVTVERAKVYHFRTEAPMVIVRNFLVKP